MGGKAPDPPDFGPQIAALNKQAEVSNEAATKAYDLGLKQLDLQRESFTKAASLGDQYFKTYQEGYDRNQALLNDVLPSIKEQMRLQNLTAGKSQDYLDTQIGAAKTAADRGQLLFDRYTGKFLPLQDKLLDTTASYFSPERAAQQAAAAKADVATSFDAARTNAEAQLTSYGIKPDSGRSEAFERASGIARAAAQAAAGTQSRLGTEARAVGFASDLYNQGQGFPSQALAFANSTSGIGGSGFSAANTSGTAGVNAGLAGVGAGNTISPSANYAQLALSPFVSAGGAYGQSGTGIYGAGVSSQGQAVSALQGAGSLQQAGFSDALQSYNANNAATGALFGGIGKLVGGGLGFAFGGPAGAALGGGIFG